MYHNLGNGKFQDVSLEAGPGITEPVAGRGCAIGDFDNDGNLDVVVNCVNDVPQLVALRIYVEEQLAGRENGWYKIKPIRHRRARVL